MKRLLVGTAVLSTCTMLAASAPAWAHVVVSPEECGGLQPGWAACF
jgi:hypothetical protein